MYQKEYTGNRELSWLQFNERCLEEAEDVTVPALERMNFVSIFASNLDEFYMVRVGSLLDQIRVGADKRDPLSGLTPKQQLKHICRRTAALYPKKDRIYDAVRMELKRKGIVLEQMDEWTEFHRTKARKYLSHTLREKLKVRFINGYQDFPILENGRMYYMAKLDSDASDYFVLVEADPSLQPLYSVGEREAEEKTVNFSYLFLSDIIMSYMDELVLPFRLLEKTRIRIIRNAEIKEKDDTTPLSEDFRQQMQVLLQDRVRQPVVRLEMMDEATQIRQFLLSELKLREKQCFLSHSPLQFDFMNQLEREIPEAERRLLQYREYEPRKLDLLPEERILDAVHSGDILSFYPYDSMDTFLRFLKEASEDPHVVEIRMTIYRMSRDTRIAQYLAQAAERGKKVRVLIELRARFDEQNNIQWSKMLEIAGCKVYYGSEALDDYKVHCKICQVVMNEMGRKTYITQVGTGNYNEKTAKLYTDFSLITYNQKLGKEISRFFKNICKERYFEDYKYILAAPQSLKAELLHQIDVERNRGSKGRIFIKVNSITDPDIIERLSKASNAGVQIRMIVRGICCIVPGIPGRTENVEIVNLVGRYLEHSRVYVFGSGREERMYIASADLMVRNTERRVELAVPILSQKLRKQIKRILLLNFKDNVKGRYIDANGCYRKKRSSGTPIDSQKMLMERR